MMRFSNGGAGGLLQFSSLHCSISRLRNKHKSKSSMVVKWLPVLLLAVSALAQTEGGLPASSSRIEQGFISCGCSPTNRGAAKVVISEVKSAQDSIEKLAAADKKRGFTTSDLINKYSSTALRLLNTLTGKYGREAVMNADAALRSSNGVNFCDWDKETMRNLRPPETTGGTFRFLPMCSGEAASEAKYLAGKQCFPATATVELDNGKRVTMAQLRIGDRVRTGPDSFSDVFLFTHRDADVHTQFVRLITAAGSKITLTKSHYLYANEKLVSAGSVRIGDALQLADGHYSPVSAIEDVSADGLYNPQTIDGNVVVDGIVSSAYTTAVHPRVAHGALLAPLRFLYKQSRVSVAVLDAIAGFISNETARLAHVVPSGPASFTA